MTKADKERTVEPSFANADVDEVGTRPRTLDEFVGQPQLCENLGVFISAARHRREALDHVLLAGPPGLGKTTLAQIIARELGVNLRSTSGPVLAKAGDLAAILTNLSDRDVLFIDEIHRLNPLVEEVLYPAMEDFELDLIIGEGPSARSVRIELPRFTLIGATTRSGTLSAPLRERFQIREHLDFYTVDELSEILKRNAVKLGVDMSPEAGSLIAKRSRGTPRVANNHLRWVRDYATSKADGKITSKWALAALGMASIDGLGLDQQDRKYLETIIRVFGGGPAGVEAIAHTINIPVDTLSDEVEPFLLRSELVVRTTRGRMVTSRAYAHLDVPPPKASDSSGSEPQLF